MVVLMQVLQLEDLVVECQKMDRATKMLFSSAVPIL